MTEQLTVQAGKRYFREDFEVTGELKGGVRGVFFDPTHGKTYVETGIEQSIKSSSDFTLVREYIEPTGILSTLTPENREKALNYEGVESHGPTAEPQDEEWGPWMYVAEGHIDVPDVWVGIETVYIDCHLHHWRVKVKKEPVVTTDEVWFEADGTIWLTDHGNTRRAIITLTDGKPSIAWED